MTEFFNQSDVKEASGMSKIIFGLALIDTLDLIEEAFIKKTRVLFQFRFNLDSNMRLLTRKKIIPFEAVNSINGGTWTVQGGEIAFSLTDCVLP